MNRIGNRVRSRRDSIGMRGWQLADAVGKTPRYIEMIEAGTRLPSIPTLFKLAAALNTTADRLLSDQAEDAAGPADTLARAG